MRFDERSGPIRDGHYRELAKALAAKAVEPSLPLTKLALCVSGFSGRPDAEDWIEASMTRT